MTRTALLTAAAVLALSIPAHAEVTAAGTQSNFQQAVSAIKDWFGKDNSDDAGIAPASATQDEALQVPPMPNPNAIEPAAGATNDDVLQVPPPYFAPQSNNGPARATAFDSAATQSAFNDAAPAQSAADLNAISSAAGDASPAEPAQMDCDAINKAANDPNAENVPDTALIEACQAPTDAAADGEPKAPAQPAFEAAPVQNPLPGTQPAAGEPPIGGAVMPGEKKSETKTEVKPEAKADAKKAKAEAPADKPAPAPHPVP